MYSSKILDIFKNPEHSGGLQGSNGIGKYVDSVCGDTVKIYLKIDENQKIRDAHFKTMGSVGAIVASSAICSAVIGMTIEHAKKVNAGEILEITGSYPEDKLYTIEFAIKGLMLAIEDYYEELEKEESGKKPKKENKVKKESLLEKVEEEFVAQRQNKGDDEIETDKTLTVEETVDLFEKFFNADELNDINSVSLLHSVENAKSYTPVVETKVLTDEQLKALEGDVKEDKKEKTNKSDAKAKFDELFE